MFFWVLKILKSHSTFQLCVSQFGWPSVFFSHGVVGLIIFGAWALLYVDQPQSSRHVSKLELQRIQKDKSVAQICGDNHKIPYRVGFKK